MDKIRTWMNIVLQNFPGGEMQESTNRLVYTVRVVGRIIKFAINKDEIASVDFDWEEPPEQASEKDADAAKFFNKYMVAINLQRGTVDLMKLIRDNYMHPLKKNGIRLNFISSDTSGRRSALYGKMLKKAGYNATAEEHPEAGITYENFRDFFESNTCIIEHELIGQYQSGQKKFRINFKWPKTQKAWRQGQFKDDAVYVAADSPWEAKRMADAWIKSRLEPRENDARPRKVPKRNYLKDTERRHLDMKAKVVGSWRQVIEMLGYAVETKEFPMQFIDEPELSIIADTLRVKGKEKYLQSLSNAEKKGLRAVLKVVSDAPGHWGTLGTGLNDIAMEIDPELRRKVDEVPDPWDSFLPKEIVPEPDSIYKQKFNLRDMRKILGRVNTYQDAVREALRLGVPKEKLDIMIQSRYGYDDSDYEERKRVYDELRKRLKIPSSHKVFTSDVMAKWFHDKGFSWEEFARDVIPPMGLTSIPPPPREGGYVEMANWTDRIVEWLWEIYKSGPPKKKDGSAAVRYRKALEEVLQTLAQEKGIYVGDDGNRVWSDQRT